MRTSPSRTSPRAPATQRSSSRAVLTQDWSSMVRNVRMSDLSRRVATRAWWTASGSAPMRTPGSCRMRRSTPAAMAARTTSPATGLAGRGQASTSGGPRAASPMTRTALGRARPLATSAPASFRTRTTAGSRRLGAPSRSSTSISRKAEVVCEPWRAVTSSSSTSATSRPSPSRRASRRRTVLSLATGTKAAPRRWTWTRSDSVSGMVPGSPGTSSSVRLRAGPAPSPSGSLRVQRPLSSPSTR